VATDLDNSMDDTAVRGLESTSCPLCMTVVDSRERQNVTFSGLVWNDKQINIDKQRVGDKGQMNYNMPDQWQNQFAWTTLPLQP